MHLLLFPFSRFTVSVFLVAVRGHQFDSLSVELILVLFFDKVIHFSDLAFVDFQEAGSATATTFAEEYFLFTRNGCLYTRVQLGIEM